MDQNEDDPDPEPVQDDSTTSVAENRGKKRRRSKCQKHFKIIGDKLPDGCYNIIGKHCKHPYCLDLGRNGTSTLMRHIKICSKAPGSTPGSSNKKFDIIVFHEMIVGAIVEHDLAYSFVEYRRIREAFSYANPSIELQCRNTGIADVLMIFENEKAHLRKVLSEVPGRICLTTNFCRAITVEGYLCLTAHYVHTNWKLKAKIV